MEATRVRFVPLLEWLLAAGLILGAAAAGTMAVRDLKDLHGVRAVTPVSAAEAPAPDPPPVVPPRAVLVPMLPLPDGKVLRVGDAASQILDRLGAWAQIGGDSLERDGVSERITRFYEYAGARFALVLESRPNQDARVVAIYRQ
jgi:hypothetical protein